MTDTTHSTARPTKVGAWFIGARGSLATTATVGLGALSRGLVEPYGVTTAAGDLADAPFVDFSDIMVGGHDIAGTPLEKKAAEIAAGGVFPAEIVSMVASDLARADAEVRVAPTEGPTQQHDIDQMAADIEAFRVSHHLRTVVVVDISSTRPSTPRRRCARPSTPPAATCCPAARSPRRRRSRPAHRTRGSRPRPV